MLKHACAFAVIALGLAALPASAQVKDAIVIDLPNDAATLDPHVQWDTDSYTVYRNIFDNLVTRVPLQDVKIVCTAILIQRESGGNLAEVLEKTSTVIRERFRLKRQIMTHTAQGRLTGWILTLLPVVLGLLLYMVNPDLMSNLWKKELGIKLLYAAGGMIIIGGLIIRKIVNMDV